SFLRIEYCQDMAGFYLEPHTDVGAKLVTMMIHLSREPGSENWGTDLYRPGGAHACRIRSAFNSGYLFVPGSDTWHGFEPRAISGVRRSLIVNYVKPEWRSRHELAFPYTPVA
ncbi:MAG: 2OG-Fe(II) oxygenase, partial [Rhizomicrobium sp.]